MRRLLLAGLGVALVATQPAHAAVRPQLTDPRGDWTFSSQDVLSGRLSSALAGGKPVLVGELTLVAGPASGVATTYGFGFAIGCQDFTYVYTWRGAEAPSEAHLERMSWCAPRAETVTVKPDETLPATVRLRGTTLVWQSPYGGLVARGAKVHGFFGAACSAACGVFVGDTFSGQHEYMTGDVAVSRGTYVVGSDLSRR